MNAVETFHFYTDTINHSQLKDKTPFKIQRVPLATEPGISLIILPCRNN